MKDAETETMNEKGLEKEIRFLKNLLKQAELINPDDLDFKKKLILLEKVGKASADLAKLVKAQQELGKEDADPNQVLEQALKELEEEWPELRKFGEQFSMKKASEKNERSNEENT